VLSSQCRETLQIVDSFGELDWWLVKKFKKDVLQTVKEDKGIEGYIVEFSDRSRVKIKSDWYSTLHKTKDSISTPKNLYECCINEQADDLISMFIGDDFTINQIKEMQSKASKDFYEIKNTCETWYNHNKHLERKDYAIKTQNEYKDKRFGLCMSLYLGKKCDYIGVLLENFLKP
jgi:T4 RnlA family RNA ligase